jgi:ribonuclease P protein component
MYQLRKDERLRSKIAFSRLFSEGNKIFHFPFKVCWETTFDNSPAPARIAVAVSKRKHKKATDRNYLRRCMKETYRYSKNQLYSCLDTKHIKINFCVIYVADKKLDFRTLDLRFKELLQLLMHDINSKIK